MRYTNTPIDFSDEKKDKDNDSDKCKDIYRDKDKDYCLAAKHPKPKKILLECGCNPQDAIFEIDDNHG